MLFTYQVGLFPCCLVAKLVQIILCSVVVYLHCLHLSLSHNLFSNRSIYLCFFYVYKYLLYILYIKICLIAFQFQFTTHNICLLLYYYAFLFIIILHWCHVLYVRLIYTELVNMMAYYVSYHFFNLNFFYHNCMLSCL